MDRFDQVDAAYERLLTFCQMCSLPRARALAAANFLLSLPNPAGEYASYWEEAGAILVAALREPQACSLDSAEPAVFRQALGLLRENAQIEEGEVAALLARLVPSSAAPPAGMRADGAFLIQVPVPLVCELPPGAHETDVPHLGVLTTVTVAARALGPQDARVVWNNANLGGGSNRLRLLGDVAADVRMIARHTLYDLCRCAAAGGSLEGLSRRALGRIDLDRLGFELSLPEKEMPVAGSSVSLALGSAMCGVMIGLLRRSRGLMPRPDLAWTGLLSPSGEVQDVDADSLRAKVQVARAAGLSGIVVARTQGDLACRVAAEIAWEGEIHTVGTLRELFQRPQLLCPLEVPAAILAACRRPRLQRFAAAGILAIMLLGLVLLSPRLLDEIGVYWFPLWRPPPELAQVSTPGHISAGFQLRVPRMADLHFTPEKGRRYAFALLVPEVGRFKGPGPYLVLGESIDFEDGKDGRVMLLHIPTRQVVAKYQPVSTWLPNAPVRETSANLYNVKRGLVADVDGDGNQELVISITFNPTARCALQILDEDFNHERSLEHPGHLEHLAARDLDGDGRSEIIALGFHGPTRGMSLLVLKVEDFYTVHGAAELQPPSRYGTEELSFDPGAQPCYRHIVLPLRPWMEEVPDNPFEQLGLFELSAGPDSNDRVLIQTVAAMNAAGCSIILTLGLPAAVLDVTFAQSFRHRVRALRQSGSLPADAMERFEEDIRASLYSRDTIIMDAEFGDRGNDGD